mmetsp:Transcript_53830/g.73535  ORF Transcript_53830/g.73535 Transcript_53830/m.73535 type:complete len:254 (+) Transcript_53830:331-1092(+)
MVIGRSYGSSFKACSLPSSSTIFRCKAVLFAEAATADMSAPVSFGGITWARRVRSTSSSSDNFRVAASNTFKRLDGVASMPRYRSRSKRPGRRREGSSRSGLFVAPITNTKPSVESAVTPVVPLPSLDDGAGDDLSPRLSSSVRSCDTTRSITPPESDPRPLAGARESSSSKKRTQGAEVLAASNTFLTFFSDSPMYMSNSSGPLTDKKASLHSVATALAMRVFPVPGGPNSNAHDRWRGACTHVDVSGLSAS